jgi:two-component system, NtrC family, response regulator PilR
VIELRVPSLRERVGDIPLIAESILHRIAERSGLPPTRLSEAAVHALQRHPFPGNVRELENVLERALALAPGVELQAGDLRLPEAVSPQVPMTPLPPPASAPDGATAGKPPEVPAAAPDSGETQAFEVEEGVPTDLEAYLGSVERDAIVAALARTGHNRTAAAQLLGISFRQMRYRMRRLGLK